MFPSTAPKITSITTVAMTLLCRFFLVTGLSLGLLLGLLSLNQVVANTEDQTSPDGLGSITGMVRNEQGTPLTGIRLLLQKDPYFTVARIVTTTATGAYTIPVLTTGIYRLQAVDPHATYGSLYYPQETTFTGGHEIPVAGNQVTNRNFTLALAAQVTGRVTILNEVTATSGRVLVYDQVDEAWALVTSSEITHTGSYTVDHLPPGTFRFCAFTAIDMDQFDGCYGGATPQTATDVTVTAGTTLTDLTIVIGENQFNGVITGTVTENGTPLAGIKTTVYRSSPWSPAFYTLTYALADASGQYTIGGLAEGNYELGFSDPSGVYASIYYKNQISLELAHPITVKKGSVVTGVNVALQRAGMIRGTAHTGTGQPAAHAPIYLYYYYAEDRYWVPLFTIYFPDPYPDLELYTNDDGGYIIGRLWPGRYRLCIAVNSYSECYGSTTFTYGSYPDFMAATDIIVQAGAIATGIDLVVGPDEFVYLPLVAQ